MLPYIDRIRLRSVTITSHQNPPRRGRSRIPVDDASLPLMAVVILHKVYRKGTSSL